MGSHGRVNISLQLIKIDEKKYYATFYSPLVFGETSKFFFFHFLPQMSVEMVRNCNPRSLVNGIKIAFAMRAGKEWT